MIRLYSLLVRGPRQAVFGGQHVCNLCYQIVRRIEGTRLEIRQCLAQKLRSVAILYFGVVKQLNQEVAVLDG